MDSADAVRRELDDVNARIAALATRRVELEAELKGYGVQDTPVL